MSLWMYCPDCREYIGGLDSCCCGWKEPPSPEDSHEYRELQEENDRLTRELAEAKARAAEVEALRAALSQCATAVGASAAPDCSVEFLACVPREVELVVEKLRAVLVRARRGLAWASQQRPELIEDYEAVDAAIAARKGEGSEG